MIGQESSLSPRIGVSSGEPRHTDSPVAKAFNTLDSELKELGLISDILQKKMSPALSSVTPDAVERELTPVDMPPASSDLEATIMGATERVRGLVRKLQRMSDAITL